MASFAFGNKTDATKFAAKKNKSVTKKYHWIVKQLDGSGYVVMRVGANVKASQIKNVRTNP